VKLSLPAFDCDRSCRVLLGTAGEESPPHVIVLTAASSQSQPEHWHSEIEAPDDVIAAAVYTEDLESGEWNTELVNIVAGSR
jgi:hypothetical protein